MIEVKNLVKKYGNHLAVDHLDFQIKPGMVYGFLGPNGAGKSTTMNIMTGCMGATQGEVLINGYDILKEPEKAKRYIGYLPEHPPLYMDMTVREYLDFAAELKGIRKSQRREAVDEAEKMVKVQDVEHRLIRNLSKGYRQRVGLAQAILGFPDMIILDEPSVGLDRSIQDRKKNEYIFHNLFPVPHEASPSLQQDILLYFESIYILLQAFLPPFNETKHTHMYFQSCTFCSLYSYHFSYFM